VTGFAKQDLSSAQSLELSRLQNQIDRARKGGLDFLAAALAIKKGAGTDAVVRIIAAEPAPEEPGSFPGLSKKNIRQASSIDAKVREIFEELLAEGLDEVSLFCKIVDSCPINNLLETTAPPIRQELGRRLIGFRLFLEVIAMLQHGVSSGRIVTIPD
jgi:hypothetical protein